MSEPLLFSYGVQSLFVGGPSPYSPNFESVTITNIEGVLGANVALSYPRLEAYGWDGGGEQALVERPNVELGFSYVFASGLNESRLGFVIAPTTTSSALGNINAERNFYLLFNQDHRDLIGYSGWNNKVMAFGNAVMTRYDFNASVGQPTMVNVSMGALNLLFQPSGSGQILPSVYKQSGISPTGRYILPFASQSIKNYFESAPSSIVLSFDTGSAIGMALSGQNACPLQSFGFTIDIPRQPSKDLGWAYPDTRAARWPITIEIKANAYINGLQADALNRFGCPDSGMNFGVSFKNACQTDSDGLTYQFNGAKLDSQSITSQIGSSSQVSLSWSLKIADINRLYPNFYMTQTGNYYSSIVFPEVDYVSGSSPLTYNLGTNCYLLVLSGPGYLDGNRVYVTDDTSTVVVRAITTDLLDTRDLVVQTTA